MELLPIILTALATGASDTAIMAIKDAYTGLKDLILRKLSTKPDAQVILNEYVTDPTIYNQPLAKLLSEIHAEKDPEVLSATQHLLQLLQVTYPEHEQYAIHNSGSVQGQIIGGSHHKITQTFSELPVS